MKQFYFLALLSGVLGHSLSAALLTSNTGLGEHRIVTFEIPNTSNFVAPPYDFSAELGERVTWTGSVDTIWSPTDSGFGNNGGWRNVERRGYIGSSIRSAGERVWIQFDFKDAPASAVTVFMNYTRGPFNGGDFGNPYVRMSALDHAGNLLESHTLTDVAPIVTDGNTDAGQTRGISRGRNEIASLLIETNGRFFAIDDLRIARLTGGRLGNMSTRSVVAAGGNLNPGFVILGEPAKLLFRAIGPGLAGFNVAGYMPNPRLVLFKGNTQIATNDDWSQTSDSGASIAAAASAAGAFPLATGSKDAALVATLLPGTYTLLVTDTTGAAGDVLAECYQLP
ncbi:MAG: hypothetical protein V4773_14990 [Verrucomicrobiota bacterium]